MRNGTDWSPRFAVFGDMGNENAKSLTRLQREVHLGTYDALIHVGDFAYDMDTVRAKYHQLIVLNFFLTDWVDLC